MSFVEEVVNHTDCDVCVCVCLYGMTLTWCRNQASRLRLSAMRLRASCLARASDHVFVRWSCEIGYLASVYECAHRWPDIELTCLAAVTISPEISGWSVGDNGSVVNRDVK